MSDSELGQFIKNKTQKMIQETQENTSEISQGLGNFIKHKTRQVLEGDAEITMPVALELPAKVCCLSELLANRVGLDLNELLEELIKEGVQQAMIEHASAYPSPAASIETLNKKVRDFYRARVSSLEDVRDVKKK